MIGRVLIEEGHVWTVIIIFGNILQRLTTVKELAQYRSVRTSRLFGATF